MEFTGGVKILQIALLFGVVRKKEYRKLQVKQRTNEINKTVLRTSKTYYVQQSGK